MAVEPLYNVSRDTLLSRARMLTADDEQTVSLIDQSIQEVRLGFFKRLGKDRAKTIAGYAYSDNPDTDEEELRVNAAAVEVNWLRYLLIQRLPHITMAEESAVRDNWDQDPLTRDASYLRDYLKSLKEEINTGIGDLQEPEDPNSGNIKSAYNVPDVPYLNSENFVGLHSGRGIPYGRS